MSMPRTAIERQCRRAPVQRVRFIERHAELALLQTGRDVRMRARVDVRVHAEADRRARSRPRGDAGQVIELARRLHVEAEDAGAQRRLPFPPRSCRRRRRRRWPDRRPPRARARARRPTRCRSRCRAARTDRGSRATDWPSSRSRRGAAGPRTRRRTHERRASAAPANRRSKAFRIARRSTTAARLRRKARRRA